MSRYRNLEPVYYDGDEIASSRDEYINTKFMDKDDFESILNDIESDVKSIVSKLEKVEGLELIDDIKELIEKLESDLY